MPTKSELIDALVSEWESLCHDNPEPDDETPEEMREFYNTQSYEQLVIHTCCDDDFTLEEYLSCYP